MRPTFESNRRLLFLVLGALACLAGPGISVSTAEEAVETQLDRALQGPWRWLEPELAAPTQAADLALGPWLEPAITLDPERRLEAVRQLSLPAPLPVIPEESPSLSAIPPAAPPPPTAAEEEQPARAPILRRAALDSARVLEAANESAAAAEAYAGVIEAAEQDGDEIPVDVWHGLAVSLARAGDAVGAERAFLSGLDASGMAAEQIRFRYDLAGFYRSRGRLLEAVAIVDALLQHAPESREIGEARSALASSIEWTALVLARGDALEWPPPPPEPGWEKVDPRVTELLAWVPEPLRRFSFYPGQVVATVGILRSAAYLGAGVLVLIALLLLRRQRGDIAVAIEYPEELRGIFRVRWRGSRKRLPDTTTEEQISHGPTVEGRVARRTPTSGHGWPGACVSTWWCPFALRGW